MHFVGGYMDVWAGGPSSLIFRERSQSQAGTACTRTPLYVSRLFFWFFFSLVSLRAEITVWREIGSDPLICRFQAISIITRLRRPYRRISTEGGRRGRYCAVYLDSRIGRQVERQDRHHCCWCCCPQPNTRLGTHLHIPIVSPLNDAISLWSHQRQ